MTGIAVTGFYTCIVLRVGIFGSEIIAEEHFHTEKEARDFCQTVADGHITVIVRV